MLGLPVQIGHEGYIDSLREPMKFYTVLALCFCDNYAMKCTCYSLQSERIYTYQNEMEDLQMSREWTKEELNTASEIMKQNGEMGFEEFCHALEQKQPVGFDLRDRERKELVKDISEILGEKAEYMRMPTCAYRIGDYTIAKDASLTWSADTADSDAELLLQKLADKGWQASILISREPQEGTQVESQS